jgi:UDP:flavonoid glycosyltransferase YjiC (YdhE family)
MLARSHDGTVMALNGRQAPRVLFFSINGSGTGHLSRCLAYARRLEGRARPVFFSLASAIEIIEALGFEADYLVSPFWSHTPIMEWNRELAVRVGLMLEALDPQVVVFDGTWPFPGLLDACDAHGVPRRVWSNRQLHKPDAEKVPVAETLFDLVIEPGEIGTAFSVERAAQPGRKVRTPPVTLFDAHELPDRERARSELGLDQRSRYALFTLGPGNLKDVGDIARRLIEIFGLHGYTIVWARAPITVRDVMLPDGVVPISVYPLARFLRAFDVVASAAGYNSCYEIAQAGVPALLVPNTQVMDDQTARAHRLADHARIVVSACETDAEAVAAVARLLEIEGQTAAVAAPDLDGAARAADEIFSFARDAGRA